MPHGAYSVVKEVDNNLITQACSRSDRNKFQNRAKYKVNKIKINTRSTRGHRFHRL